MATMSNCLPNSGLPPTHLEGRSLTSIVLNLTSPKFHFATLELTQSDIRFSISRIWCVAWPGGYISESEPKDKAHCDSIIFIASTKCKIKKQQTPLTKTSFFVLDITYRLMIMMAGVPIPLITISKDRLFCRVPCEIMF